MFPLADLGDDDLGLDLGLKKKKKKKKPLDVSALENDLNELNLDGEEGDEADAGTGEEVSGITSIIPLFIPFHVSEKAR